MDAKRLEEHVEHIKVNSTNSHRADHSHESYTNEDHSLKKDGKTHGIC
jgi:hypothetical protein